MKIQVPFKKGACPFTFFLSCKQLMTLKLKGQSLSAACPFTSNPQRQSSPHDVRDLESPGCDFIQHVLKGQAAPFNPSLSEGMLTNVNAHVSLFNPHNP
jgi:hypothetical protein